MKLTTNIYLSIKGERILKETDWLQENPKIPTDILFEIGDLVKTGLLYYEEGGSVHLTDIGEEVLLQLK